MGSVDSEEICPECGGVGYYSCYYRRNEESFLCHACGFAYGNTHEQDSVTGEWHNHEYKDLAEGVVSVMPKNGIGTIGQLNKGYDKVAFAKWLEETKQNPDLGELFVTAYDQATRQVTVVENINASRMLHWLPRGHPLRPTPCEFDYLWEVDSDGAHNIPAQNPHDDDGE